MINNINLKLTWLASIKLGMGVCIGFGIVKGIFVIVGTILAFIFKSGVNI